MTARPEPGPTASASGPARESGQPEAGATPRHPGALLAASRDVLFEVDPSGTITWARDSAGILGEVTLLGARLADLFDPVDAAALLACLDRADAADDLPHSNSPGNPDPCPPDPYVARLPGTGGQERRLEVVLRPIHDRATGELVGGAGTMRDTSEQAELLAQLQAERRRTAAMFSGHDAIMLLVDPDDGAIVDANQAACRFYGYQRVVLTGLHITDLNMLPLEQVRARMAQARAGSTNAFVFPHRLADGSVRQVEVHSSPIVDHTGRTVLFSIVRDVTEELVAAAERDLMTTRYHRLASMASDVVAEGDNDGLLRWISESVSRVLGFPADTLVGRPFLNLVHPDDRPATRTAQAEVTAGKEASLQVRLETRGGGYRLMSIQLRPVRDGSGAVVGRVAGWRDITEAERARAELADREALLSQVLDGTTDAVMLTRPGRPVWVSQSFTETFGWRPEDLYDNPLLMIPVTERDAYRSTWQEIRAARRTRADHRIEVVCADGSQRWVDSRSRIVWTPAGELSRIISSLRDVTDQVVLEQNLRDSEALLKASLERLLDPHVYVQAVRDPDGSVVDFRHILVNDAACRYLRLERSDIIGRTIREVVSGRGVDTLVEWLRTALAAGALLVDAQPMFSSTQARLRLFDVRAAKVGDGVTFTWRDVTERYG